jgi:hypothetical protein
MPKLKKQGMYRTFIILFSLFFSVSTAFAAGFEGKIKIMKKTIYDTCYYYYQVKEQKVRVDEYNKENKLVGSLIIDLENEKVWALNTLHKVYRELKPNQNYDKNEKNYTVIKTNNSKTINGYLCYQWRVRNKDKNSEIAYWVMKDGFTFFESMIKILNNFGNCSEFFLHIPDNKGFLPILTVERTLVRYEKLRLMVTDIQHVTIDKSIFDIPSDYKKFEY